jgi:hypothetical protein
MTQEVGPAEPVPAAKSVSVRSGSPRLMISLWRHATRLDFVFGPPQGVKALCFVCESVPAEC